MASIPVVILCGGLGTRLGSVDGEMPKPMVRIGRFPLIAHIIKNFESMGFDNFILLTGYKSDSVVNYFANWHLHRLNKICIPNSITSDVEYKSKIEIVWTGNKTETGGRLFKALDVLSRYENFIVTYGDTLTNINVNELVKFHASSSNVVTMALGHPTSRFGEAQIDDHGKVTAFKEKPKLESLASIGLLVVNKKFLEVLDENSILEEAPMNYWVNNGSVQGFIHDGFWMPLDTNREYEYFLKLESSEHPPWLSA